jgi:hypothetical protein
VTKCEKSFVGSTADLGRYDTERGRCIDQYAHSAGSTAQSGRSFCIMEAARVIHRQWSCKAAAQTAAQARLDQEAKSIGFDSSSVGAVEFQKSFKDHKTTRYLYRGVGEIYKSSYRVDVTTDVKCVVSKTSVKDISPR